MHFIPVLVFPGFPLPINYFLIGCYWPINANSKRKLSFVFIALQFTDKIFYFLTSQEPNKEFAVQTILQKISCRFIRYLLVLPFRSFFRKRINSASLLLFISSENERFHV